MFDFNKLAIIGCGKAIEFGKLAHRYCGGLLHDLESKLVDFSTTVYSEKIEAATTEPTVDKVPDPVEIKRECPVRFYNDEYEDVYISYNDLQSMCGETKPFTETEMRSFDNLRTVGFTVNEIKNVVKNWLYNRNTPSVFDKSMLITERAAREAFIMKYVNPEDLSTITECVTPDDRDKKMAEFLQAPHQSIYRDFDFNGFVTAAREEVVEKELDKSGFTELQKEYFKCAVNGKVSPKLAELEKEQFATEVKGEFTPFDELTINTASLMGNERTLLDNIKYAARLNEFESTKAEKQEKISNFLKTILNEKIDPNLVDPEREALVAEISAMKCGDELSAMDQIHKFLEHEVIKKRNSEIAKTNSAEFDASSDNIKEDAKSSKQIKDEEIMKIGEGTENLTPEEQLHTYLQSDVIVKLNQEVVDIDKKVGGLEPAGYVHQPSFEKVEKEMKSHVVWPTEENKE